MKAKRVARFEELEGDFRKRTDRIVWCTVTTVDDRNQPVARILHPIWEGSTGWILSARRSLKTRHLAGNAKVSLSYWDPQQEHTYVEARATWEDRDAEKRRLWDLFENTPAPIGYDPAAFFQSPDNPQYGVLRLDPTRIEVGSLGALVQGQPPVVWEPGAK
jgi:general stress protein 26